MNARAKLASWIMMAASAAMIPPAHAYQNYLQEGKEERSRRMRWWREARFGMFIHWGLYAVPAGEYKGRRSEHAGEWIQSWANISREEYGKFAGQFHPVSFNAAEWVGIAKAAGMKYIVITSKHHDGFALYDSKISDYDVADATPFGRDPIAELNRECRKQDVRLCFYYSIMDWHHPSQYVDAPGKARTAGNDNNRMIPEQKPVYVEYMKTQLEELITRYDPGVLWFDGEWVDWWTGEDGRDLYNYVRRLKPSIIVNNRVGKGRRGMQGLDEGPEAVGDFGTPEQEIPPTGLPDVHWEACMTMNETWGYKAYDDKWKPAEMLIRNLIDIASKGGNYLLNVGPTAEGRIPEPSVSRLRAVGAWLKVNGESIYGAGPSPFKSLAWGRATQKGNRLYLHVFDWPEGELRLPGLRNAVRKAYLLGAPGKKLQVEQHPDSIVVKLPGTAPDGIATVVVLDLDGPPRPN